MLKIKPHFNKQGGNIVTYKMNEFKVASAQVSPVWMDVQRTISKACSIVREATENGAKIIAFPETYIPAYPYWNWIYTPLEGSQMFKKLYMNSITADDEILNPLLEVAKERDCYIVMGINEKDKYSRGTLYNTNLTIGPEGILGVHRKLVPTFAEKLSWGGGDGSGLNVFETKYGNIGNLTCGENLNTLARFSLLAQGEDIHIANYPAFPFNNQHNFVDSLKIRGASHSLEGKVFTIICCGVLTEEIINDVVGNDQMKRDILESTPNAYSSIYGPNGEMLNSLLDDEGIVYADIDLTRCIEPKQFHDIVGHYNNFSALSLHLNTKPAKPMVINQNFSSSPGQQEIELSQEEVVPLETVSIVKSKD